MKHFEEVILENKTEANQVLFKLDKYHLKLISQNDQLFPWIKHPSSVTFVPQFCVFLVSERSSRRLGVFEENFKFRTWLNTEYPLIDPSKILCLSNGFIVIVDQENLHIHDASLSFIQTICGCFHGLTEGANGVIFTIQQSTEKSFLKGLKKYENDLVYKWTYSTELVVAQEFSEWSLLSECRFLLFDKNLLYITDSGLQKLYIVDLITHKQIASQVQLERPAGLLMDDCGNLLISDCCRIISWNTSLQTSHIMIDGIPHLTELVRYQNRILALRSKKRGEAIIAELCTFQGCKDSLPKTWFDHAVCRNVAKTR